MKHLDWPLEEIPFVTRETVDGKPIPFRCGRDFLFYALKYYGQANDYQHPEQIEGRVGGKKLPKFLIWTMLHMKPLLNLINCSNLALSINNRRITSWFSLIFALAIPKPVSYETVLQSIENTIASNTVTGIDIAISWFGLVDHVLFVYGYDDEYIYVLDTLEVDKLDYENNLDIDRFLMKLPKTELRKRLSIWSRIWQIVPRET